MQDMIPSFEAGECIDAPLRLVPRQRASKELRTIYLQEARLRRKLETPIDDDNPSTQNLSENGT